ncbi:MAG: hypothetical protein AAFZ15_29005 [Bacteroidota bacterium]
MKTSKIKKGTSSNSYSRKSFFTKNSEENFISKSKEGNPFFSPLEEKDKDRPKSELGKWVKGESHQTIDLAEYLITGGAGGTLSPATVPTINGQLVQSDEQAVASMKNPAIKTVRLDNKWKLIVQKVPGNIGSYWQRTLKKGPWTTTVMKKELKNFISHAEFKNSNWNTDELVKIKLIGIPSDSAIYQANIRHENKHARDHKKTFKKIIIKWEKRILEVIKNKMEFSDEKQEEAYKKLWAEVGGSPQQIAREYYKIIDAKADEYHNKPKGKGMKLDVRKISPDHSEIEIEVTNPA